MLLTVVVIAAGLSTSFALIVPRAFTQFAFAMVSNPLQNVDDKLSTIIPAPPDGTTVFFWDVPSQDLDGVTVPTFVSGTGWVPDAIIKPGQGFFVMPGGNFVNNFTGNARVGCFNSSLTGGYAFDAIGSLQPGPDLLSNVLSCYPATDGDTVFRWNEALQDIDPIIPTYSAVTGTWIPNVVIQPAEGFFIARGGGGVAWICCF